jgi:hypothetical protein
MAQDNSNNEDDLDDPAFRTQKLSGGSIETADILDQPKVTGTEDKRVKAMEEAVQRAKKKQKPTGVSIEDAYSADESESKKSIEHQKATHTLRLKRTKETTENEAENTIKIRSIKNNEALSADSASLLNWRHWLFLLISVLLTIAIVYLLMAP